MPIARLRPEDAAIVVVDVQERLLPPVADPRRLVNNCAILIQMAGVLGIPVLATEHYPAGLGRTVEEVANALPNPAARIEKTRFSAVGDVLEDTLNEWTRSAIMVCGLEAQVCVLQTVLDLQASGRQCFVISDAISASQPDQIAPAIRRMEAAGAVTTGVMSAMYELLGDAAHPARRACVELAKRIML